MKRAPSSNQPSSTTSSNLNADQRSRKRIRHHSPAPAAATSSSSNEHPAFSTAHQQQQLGLFLSRVRGVDASTFRQHNANALSVSDLLSSHGLNGAPLARSAHFNYLVDIDWLVEQYPLQLRRKPLLLVVGRPHAAEEVAALQQAAQSDESISIAFARLPIPFGTHHSKMMLLEYDGDGGIRVVVHTANLIEYDWFQKTQGIWMSPLLLPMPRDLSESGETSGSGKSCEISGSGDSATGFRRDLIAYLQRYQLAQLSSWIDTLARHDFSAVNAHLLASIPGAHQAEEMCKWGHLRLRHLLRRAISSPLPSRTPIIAQFSSIGSLGAYPGSWLTAEFLKSLASTGSASSTAAESVPSSQPEISLIFPSVDNVRSSLEGYGSGGGLPYTWRTHQRQQWLTKFLHQWRSEALGRSGAIPHIKTYCRVDEDMTRAHWFLLTSANLSKAAWGVLQKNASQLHIRSWELGVLLVSGSRSIRLENSIFSHLLDEEKASTSKAEASLTLPYDLPLEPYRLSAGVVDEPWMGDRSYTELDTHEKSVRFVSALSPSLFVSLLEIRFS